jgi:hypothetical protein
MPHKRQPAPHAELQPFNGPNRSTVHRPPPPIATLGWVTFESYGTSSTYRFTCLLGDSTPNPTAGYGGWQPVSHPRRRATTEWQGNDPLAIEISLMFDGFAAARSVEGPIRQLEKMSGLEEGMGQPPFVAFDSGGVIPHDATHKPDIDWVISDLKWGDADRRLNDGARVRQAGTVTVMQVHDEDQLSAASPAAKRRRQKRRQVIRTRAQKGAKHKKYTVKDRETMESIAAKPVNQGGLGRSSRWHEIKKLNPKWRDPKRVLPLGTILTMP